MEGRGEFGLWYGLVSMDRASAADSISLAITSVQARFLYSWDTTLPLKIIPDPQHDPDHDASHCVLPLFHKPATAGDLTSITPGYISGDGHLFECEKPDNALFHM
jgi:hypothetical protein